ncbi:MAG: hypothetical protein II768_03770 [Clostridia bacterium]|nr:hypothetical protein [Clostridia bacterium]
MRKEDWTVSGRPENCRFDGDTIRTKDAFAVHGSTEEENLALTFSARAPEDAPQTEIWASVRWYSRDYHYMIGLRGGAHNHLYLSRLGAGGYDRMLGLCPLDFTVMPGVWYRIRIVCAGQKIAVYLGEEASPRLLAEDPDAPFQAGSIAVGGGYTEAEYREISVESAAPDALNGVTASPDYLALTTLSKEEKEAVRRRHRALYRPFSVPMLPEGRMELSLEGDWLFLPEQEVSGDPSAPLYDDRAAHTMNVPECWIPLQAWLEGETWGEEQMNKGQSDTYWVEAFSRCMNYTFDWQETVCAWYRHYLDLPEGIGKKSVLVDFEGIALASEIYINGERIHENIGMFAPMTVELTEHVHPGRNVLAVKVSRILPQETLAEEERIDDKYALARDGEREEFYAADCEHRPFNTEDLPHGFYTNHPGGIWRSVRLIVCDRLRVEDCWFRPRLDGARIEASVANGDAVRRVGRLSYALRHTVTGEYLCGGEIGEVSLDAGEAGTYALETPKVSPRLWEPGRPNLYALTLTLTDGERVIDTHTEEVGFRTVSLSGSRLIYNGRPLWVRGGNHMPAHVMPNDRRLAETFIRLSLAHNVIGTRTHAAPWTDVWLDAADRAGMLVSFEGTWSWLMLVHIPSDRSLEIWKKELRALYLRHRNRPSLFLITMNNEMNFYLSQGSDETLREKAYRVQGGLRIAREVFPDLPLVCDSGYNRAPTLEKSRDLCFPYANGRYERVTRKYGFDDGDVDDPHFYYGWYDKDFFHFMHGEFGWRETLCGRPCILQELSVGYCRDEDGRAVRFYLYAHQVPQTTTGRRAYEHNDPKYFRRSHAFQVKSLAETFRRVEHERVCGTLLFAFETWFYHHTDALRVQPMLSAERLKMAYQPVLVCAELYARHFYAGEVLNIPVTLIHDDRERDLLTGPEVTVSVTADGQVLASSREVYEDIPYFGTASRTFSIRLSEKLPGGHATAKLVLTASCGGQIVSRNEYEITLSEADYANPADKSCRALCLSDDAEAAALLRYHHIDPVIADEIPERAEDGLRLVIARTLDAEESRRAQAFATSGGQVVLVNQRDLSPALTGGREIRYTEDATEIVTMNAPENSVFRGIEEGDTSWFDNGEGVPYAAYGRYGVDRFDRSLCALGETLQWHSYIGKPTDYEKSGGTPLFALRCGDGGILVSSLRTDADRTDPVACRLTDNILTWDFAW